MKEGENMSFVELQVISTNSLMKSTLTVEDLIINAKNKGYQALALTDHNVLFGVLEFYERAIQHGIKPIIGLTLDVESYTNSGEYYPFILLAKNKKGYQELIQLSTNYQLSEQDFVPAIDLINRSNDLIVIAAGNESEIIDLIKDNREVEAGEISRLNMKKIANFYQGISLQDVESNTIQSLKKLSVPLIALGNVKYLAKTDALPSRVLEVLNSDMQLNGEEQEKINRFLAMETKDYSLFSPEDRYKKFQEANLEGAAQETVKIAKKIDVQLNLDQHVMPTFPLAEGETADTYLKNLCQVNLKRRVANPTVEYIERLNKELDVISKMGFSDYFLIVWDIMVYAHSQNIYTGSGRGSAAGSLVAYLLHITNVDPIEFDLLFERFLNKERYSLPDIDLDFPDNRREEILQYILKKYGPEHVAQIGTIGRYGAKSAVRDVGRVFGLSQEELRKWSQAIPSGANVSLKKSFKNKRLNDLINDNDLNRRIYQIASKIEGSNRHVSTHAAGIVVSDEKLIKRVPLQEGSENIHLTQYTMDAVEKAGLLKLDVLGLRNLATLSDCIRFIPFENKGISIDIDSIPFDDEKTLAIFRAGNTDGVFQFESEGIRRVLRKLRPSSFEDIVAVNALYRPGPMEQIDTFINRKNGKEPIQYPHDDLKEILEPTYGIMVYQEQVMKVATKLAGYTLNEADILRRAIGKKDHQAIEKGRKEFVAGALRNNYSEETALSVYGYIEKFGDYGFNRSHAVAYSKVAYQLAYVKANYPASFFAAIMKTSNKEKMQTYLSEARGYGVGIIAADINKSYHSFIIDDGKIRCGFNVIKGLANNFKQEIIDERQKNGEYKGLIDFVSRIDKKWLTEEQILPLIHSGTLDSLEKTRHSLIYSLTNVLESVQMSHGNTELFALFSPKVIEKEELADEVKMEQEFQSTGFYFTAEPGEQYKILRENKQVMYVADAKSKKYAQLLVVVKNIKSIQTKKGRPMSFIDAIDSTGEVSLTLFPDIHRRYIQKISEGDTLLIAGKVESTQNTLKVIVNKVEKADDLIQALYNNKTKDKVAKQAILYIRIQSVVAEPQKLTALQKILKDYPGETPVVLYDQKTKKQNAFKKEFFVKPQSELLMKLSKMFGEQNVVLMKQEKLKK